LSKISGFTKLVHLGMSRTDISDAGLPHLYRLRRLVELDLRGTRVTAEGVRQLKKVIPAVKALSDDG
jgi:hypothetical protein